MVQSMVQITTELPPSYIKWRDLFAPLAQYFTMEQLQNFTQDHVSNNETIGRDWFRCGHYNYARLFKGRNIVPNVISYQISSLESLKGSTKWILSSKNVMTLSWGTTRFKLDKKDFLFPFILRQKRRSHIFSRYMKDSKNWSTEERVRSSYAFNIVDCLTG